MPKCHWLPFLVELISGSRSPFSFLVELGAAMMVASTIVPLESRNPALSNKSTTPAKSRSPSLFRSSRWRKFSNVVASGMGSLPKSNWQKRRADAGSYRNSSQASSARLNQCATKYMRSMRSKPRGGRPFPALGVIRFDYCAQRLPRDEFVHLGEEDFFAGAFAVLVKRDG